ncbi:hypothetical protein NMY22_g2386 [Coprinellus aureogranulatus]|nr:hypothetical protein NMY22_g2386 [Coprinellus aureogranulatus]
MSTIPAYLRFFNCVEVANAALSYLTWDDIRTVLQLCRTARAVVPFVIRDKFKWLLYHFIPNFAFREFLALMKIGSIAIMGDVPFRLVNMNQPPVDRLVALVETQFWAETLKTKTFELHMVVPGPFILNVNQWFRDHGFDALQPQPVPYAYKDHISEAWTVQHKEPRYMVRDMVRNSILTIETAHRPSLQRRPVIRVSLMKTNAVDTALSAPSSHTTSIITNNFVVNFFPHHYKSHQELRSGARTSASTVNPISHWVTCAKQGLSIRACGRACPARPSNQPFISSPEMVKWTGDEENEHFMREVKETVLPIRFMQRCYNRRCIYFRSMAG